MQPYEKQLAWAMRSYLEGTTMKILVHDRSEWSAYLTLAAKHRILPIAYEQAMGAMTSDGLTQELLDPFKQRAYLTVAAQTFISTAFKELYEEVEKAGIKALVVKGAVCRAMYKDPDYRCSSDEDIYVRECDFERTVEVLESLGLSRVNESGTVVTFMSDRGLHIELHRTLFSGEFYSYNDYFRDVFDTAVRQDAGGYDVWTLCADRQISFLVLHAMKHFLHSGVGIRQLCDIALCASRFSKEICWDKVFDGLKKASADVFAVNVLAAGVEYFGFDWSSYGINEDIIKKYEHHIECGALLEDCIEGGVYGTSSAERTHSANITLGSFEHSGSKISGIFKSLFPPFKSMKDKYTWLTELPFLLPIAWLIRLFRYLTRRSEGTVRGTLETGKKRAKLMKKYGIIRRGVQSEKGRKQKA